MRVKVSPALEPKGEEPPTPPNAPASPPPLPRWIRTRPIRNTPVTMTTRLSVLAQKPASITKTPVLAQTNPWAAVNRCYTDRTGSRKGGLPPFPGRVYDRQEAVRLQA